MDDMDRWFNIIGLVLTFIVAPVIACIIIGWDTGDKR